MDGGTLGQPPVTFVNDTSVLHTRYNDLFVLAVAKSNVNVPMVFQYLYNLKRIFHAYGISKELDVKSKVSLVYELFDVTMDYGIPQSCSLEAIRSFITFGKIKTPLQEITNNTKLAPQITGTVDWRRNDIFYKTNELTIDVLEEVNILLSARGEVLRSDVTGRVMMNSKLSGMPECQLGLNDKLSLQNKPKTAKKQTKAMQKRRNIEHVDFEDITFHKCVRLGKFDADRTITFVPPDGEFELMRYRVVDNIENPIKIIPVVQQLGKRRVSYDIQLTSQYSAKLSAKSVTVKIPCPANTAHAKPVVSKGRAKYEPTERAIVWKITKLQGQMDLSFKCEAELMMRTKEIAWSSPPIEVDFTLGLYTASGMEVRFIKVVEKSKYKPDGKVIYQTKAGQYQIRV